eukprot:TRINITY_DN17298_c0_g1_i3.p1 TRINITY_DN17298_c0_g1~~TRINITY_DN17298_c0_g1_i3.p1  ORF type:complete len:127 (+),score=23.15 TRINITY_DN17298_c0_g1_i3:157-537(+)
MKAILLAIFVCTVSGAATSQFLDMVVLRCFDKVIEKKVYQSSLLKGLAKATVEETLQTLEYLEPYYYYHVAVALSGMKSEGFCRTEQNYTGQVGPKADVVLSKYYPLGQFAGYAFVYAVPKLYLTL